MIHLSYTLRLLTIRMLLSLISMLNAQGTSANYTSIEALENRISGIESELSHLAEFTIRGGAEQSDIVPIHRGVRSTRRNG
jgi:cob(I)alamin adenosyltransferase